MRILLDTHFLIWLATDPGELSTIECQLLSAQEHECLLSTISIWELRVKASAMVRRARAWSWVQSPSGIEAGRAPAKGS